jgi:hypothetical protein
VQPLCENPLANNSRTGDRILNNPFITVPKKTKSQSAAAATADEAVNPPAPATTSAKAAAKKGSTKPKSASAKKSVAKKKTARKATKPTPAVNNGAAAAEPREPSDADIRLRAYFIAERRVQLALQGDPALDWIEARQQLLQEARQARS